MEVIGEVVNMLFSNTMRLLQLEIPVIGLTFFQLFIGVFVVKFSIKLFSGLFGFGSADHESGGNNSKIRVDDRRANDTK